ncbi:MAG: hypothetical protein U9Q79_01170, partial [Candidatus Hydrogenedentes bacterium]|nr:hypothetical protein [Candidatus Hydrogenedentota bacterium]
HYLLQIVPAVAEQYLRWEEYDKGIELLTKTLPVLPDNRELVLMLGDFYYEKGDKGRAFEQYTRYKMLGGTEERALERIRESAPQEANSLENDAGAQL